MLNPYEGLAPVEGPGGLVNVKAIGWAGVNTLHWVLLLGDVAIRIAIGPNET